MPRILLAALALVAATHLQAQSVEWRTTFVRHGLTATYVYSRQFIDGVEVIGGDRVESLLPDGRRSLVAESLASTGRRALRPDSHGDVVYLNVGGVARLARRSFIESRPHQRYVIYRDAGTGAELRREPMFFQSQARVFSVNPVASLNRPDLQDQADAKEAVPDAAYRLIELRDLPPFGALSNANVTIVDSDLPATPRADASQPLLFDRSMKEFEEVNVFAAIDANQRYIESLGYAGLRRIIDYSIPVDAHAANGVDSSYYLQTSIAGHGALFFGDGGTDDAEDTDLVFHEYGHAIQDWIAPGSFSGAISSESRALGEGFGDYWAFSSSYQETIVSGRDPSCIADWDARCWMDDSSQQCSYPTGSDCLRRVDSTKTMSDFNRSGVPGTEHRNGEIWSSALREIFMTLVGLHGVEQGKRIADTIVLESHFGSGPNPTYRVMARRMIAVDRLLGLGASAAICGSMTSRGILAAGECDATPRGEWTWIQSPTHGVTIPPLAIEGVTAMLRVDDARAIDALGVRVDLEHPERGDLRIVLVAPDGTEVVLKEVSEDRTADVHVTFGVDAGSVQSLAILRGRSAAGEWRLRIEDRVPANGGSLLSWGLVIHFAGDAGLSQRPVSVGHRIIPVAGHVNGVGGVFVSDVQLLNTSTRTARVTLIFTPDRVDQPFSAMKLSIAPSQVVTLDDIVSSVFQTTGLGWIDVLGDTTSIRATSRIYARGESGTFGQFVASVSSADAAGSPDRLIVPRIQNDAERRTNIGITETSGAEGTIAIRYFDTGLGASLGEKVFAIAPYAHWQIRAAVPGDATAEVRVVSGGARVVAYASLVENDSNDAIFLPATRPPSDSSTVVAPVISARGANGTVWSSDLWISNADDAFHEVGATFIDAQNGLTGRLRFPVPAHGVTRATDIVRGRFGTVDTIGLLMLDLAPRMIATSRAATTSSQGSFGQFVPFRSLSDPALDASSIAVRSVLNIENSRSFRSNLGVANLASRTARVRVVIYDAAGARIGSRDLLLDPNRLMQISVGSIVASEFSGGRASVEVIDASGPLLFYGSTIDNASGDPIFIPVE